MKNVFESAIQRGGYDLSDMLRRINEYHISGMLSDQERAALTIMAREQAAAPMNVSEEISRLWAALRDLDNRVAAHHSSSPTVAEWPAWHQPTGAHDAYFAGDGMTYTDGLRYLCIAPDGVACVWPPEVAPDYWQLAA